MKYFFPRDKKGNPVGFAVPESQVFDTDGARLVDKLGVLKTDLSALSDQVEDMKTESSGSANHVITNDESVIDALPDNTIYYELVSSDSTTEP